MWRDRFAGLLGKSTEDDGVVHRGRDGLCAPICGVGVAWAVGVPVSTDASGRLVGWVLACVSWMLRRRVLARIPG